MTLLLGLLIESTALGKEPGELKPIMNFMGSSHTVEFLPDPRLVRDLGKIINLETRKRSTSLEEAIGSRPYFYSADRKQVVTFGKFLVICDLDKKTTTQVNKYKTEFAAFSPDNRWLATYDMRDDFNRPKSLMIWNIERRSVEIALAMGDDSDSPLAFSKDGKFLYYATKDKIREIGSDSWGVTREAPKTLSYSSLWFMESDDRLYAQSRQTGPVEAIDLTQDGFGKITPILDNKIVRNSHRFAAIDKTKVLLFNKDGKLEGEIDTHEKKCQTAALSPDNRYLLTGGDDWRIRIWDANTRIPLAWMSPARHSIQRVWFSSDGKYFAATAAPYHGEFWIWETRDLLNLKNGQK